MRRLLIGAGVVVAIIIAIVAFNWQSITAGPPLEITDSATVERGTIAATVNATGNVEANQEISLSFDTPGRVAEILVEEGQEVSEGDSLARLDTTDLEFAVAQAQAGIEAQEAQIAQLQQPGSTSDIAAAEAQLTSAQQNLERLQAGTNVDAARAALESAQASLNELYSTRTGDIAAAQAQVDAAQAALTTLEAGPDQAQVTSAAANVERARIRVQTAQAAYDQVKDRPDIGALPQSQELQQATIAFEEARVTYEELLKGPSADQLLQARSTLASAQSNLERVTSSSSIAAAEAQVSQAQANLNSLLAGDGTIDFSAAEAQVAQAEASLQQLRDGASEAEMAGANASLRQAQLQLEQAENNLASAEITAPFDGIVGRLGAKEGEIAPATQPMVTMVDLSAFRIEVEVDEIDIGQVETGDTVTVFVDSLPDVEIPGTIEYISPVPSVVEGVVSYPVRVLLDTSSAPSLRTGMTANVEITTSTRDDAVLIPNRFITIDRTNGTVYVERQTLTGVEQVNIAIGLQNGDLSEITSGLNEGDTIVIQRSTAPENPFAPQ